MENQETFRVTILAGILAIFFGIKQAIPQATFDTITLDFSLKFLSNIFFQILLWIYILYFLILALNYGNKNKIKFRWIGALYDFIISFTVLVIFLTLALIGIILLVMHFPSYIQAGWKTNLLFLIVFVIGAIFLTKNLSYYRNRIIEKMGAWAEKLNKKRNEKAKIKKKVKKRTFQEGLEFILSILIPSIGIIWLCGSLIELAKMTITDYSPFLDYAKISLTLFGFTLIGAVFEKNKKKHNEIIKKLFHYSIIFLSSAIGFFVLYSISFIPFTQGEFFFDKVMPIIIFICMTTGYGGLIYGSLGLLERLVSYKKEL